MHICHIYNKFSYIFFYHLIVVLCISCLFQLAPSCFYCICHQLTHSNFVKHNWLLYAHVISHCLPLTTVTSKSISRNQLLPLPSHPCHMHYHSICISELVAGQKEIVAQERQERRDQMARVSDSRKTAIYRPVVEQYSNLKVDKLRKSLSPDRKQKVEDTIRPDVRTWDAEGRRADEVNEAVRSLDNTVDFITSQGTKYSKEEDFLLKTIDPSRPRSARSPTPVHAMMDQSRGRSGSKRSGTKR